MDAAAIIDVLGSGQVAEATGCGPNTVGYWGRRGRIPVRHWPALLKLSKRLGKAVITADLLIAHWNAVDVADQRAA